MWNPVEKRLYWLDERTAALSSYDPAAGKAAPAPGCENTRAFAVRGDGSLLLFTRDGALRVCQGGAVSTIKGRLEWGPDTLIDAVAVDGEGRVCCAARLSSEPSGGLYAVSPSGAIERLLEDLGSICSLAFDPPRGLLYCCNAVSREITVRPMTGSPGASGVPAEAVPVVRVPRSLGVPRGVAVDAKGNIWAALWGGSSVMRVAPGGKEEMRVYFTARLPGGLAFGGVDLRDLYVITSGADDHKANGPGAGALYKLRPGSKGAPPALAQPA